ncbi:hypothetical protein [Streptomyces sp. NRRL F-5135]|uniref:hypothetical protein n=1 Tax=Streptomyces sp. NRRL F-5135 TaxID=1463858 RepID=UPI00131ADECA|nr:hypothetical protein [Streptomyces sp. NRRL F-5135]
MSAHPRRRPRAVRHGIGRPPKYCRERAAPDGRRLRRRVQRRAQPGRVRELLNVLQALRQQVRRNRDNHQGLRARFDGYADITETTPELLRRITPQT